MAQEKTYRITEDAQHWTEISAIDLRLEAKQADEQVLPWTAWQIEIETDDKPMAERAWVLHLPEAGRTGIAWGADATWADTTGTIEGDVEMWLNDNDAWADRN